MSETICGELIDYLDQVVDPVRKVALEAFKEEIDKSAKEVYEAIEANTPEGETGGLKRSLRMKKIKDGTYYGYTIEFEGENEKGVPYQRIANILNNGSEGMKVNDQWYRRKITKRRFISKAVHKLKTLDYNIYEHYKKGIRRISQNEKIEEEKNG